MNIAQAKKAEQKKYIDSKLHNFRWIFHLVPYRQPRFLARRFINLWTVSFSYVLLFTLDVSPRPFFNCSLRMCCSFPFFSLFSNSNLMCSMWYHGYWIKWRSNKKPFSWNLWHGEWTPAMWCQWNIVNEKNKLDLERFSFFFSMHVLLVAYCWWF